EAAGLPYEPGFVQNVTEFGFEGGQRGWRELSQWRPEITALFCINDAIALGAIEAARQLGRECPRDLSVIGFGDSPEGRHWRPNLSTFALSSSRVAQDAVELILEQRRNGRLEPRTILIPEELLLRQSTGPWSR